MARTLMIQGTCSDAGKSMLTAALCRIYSRRGYRVAPFKSQNMALNSFVTPEGAEIGRAQAVQAQAAGREPHIDMNPVLLKPEGNSRSQVVLMGRPWKTLAAAEYYRTKKRLWGEVTAAMDRLCAANDLVIAEGAGSPAEINLQAHEIVNMSVARYLDAPVLLAGDIDRGGVFASLYGTLELVGRDRDRIKGFLINKFRGDPDLLQPGIAMLTEKCGGVPTLGIVPYIPDIYLAQEDSVFIERNRQWGDREGLDIGVIQFPRLANYDDLDPFRREKGVSLRFIRSAAELGRPAALILPGTKTTLSDLAWLKETGLFRGIQELAKQGRPVVGICGGYQMMGRRIEDPRGVEGREGEQEGLGLLPIDTLFSEGKKTVRTKGVLRGAAGFLRNLRGTELEGYEIHMGESRSTEEAFLYRRKKGGTDGAVSADGRFWGSYMHGIFANGALRRGFLMSLGWEPEESGESEEVLREREFDRIADAVEEALDMDALDRMIGLPPGGRP